MDKTVKVADVSGYRTKSGNIRFVLRDEDGNEYTTFKEEIGRRALELEGRPARITYHEAQRNGYTTSISTPSNRSKSRRSSATVKSRRSHGRRRWRLRRTSWVTGSGRFLRTICTSG
jgi:hypothetical protein